MADVPLVDIVNGVPVGGSGTVQTLSTVTDVLGEVQLNPTQYTIAERLKVLAGYLDGVETALADIETAIDDSSDTVDSGAGAYTESTLRIVDASDNPTVVALQIMDDWDESDRAKVNPIVGQAGVAAGAGAVGATVQRTTWCSDSPGVADAIAGEYETVAAGVTTQSLGGTGATGDYLEAVLIVPGTTSPGVVQIKDGAGSAITIFTGGATSVTDLAPIYVPLGIKSTAGAWQVTTGTNVTAIGIGNFAA